MDIGLQSMLAKCNAPQESHTAQCALLIVALPTIDSHASRPIDLFGAATVDPQIFRFNLIQHMNP